MDPALERELEEAARKLGLTKSQYVVMAVERSLGRKSSLPLRHQPSDAATGPKRHNERLARLGAEGSPLQKKLHALLRARLLTDTAPAVVAARPAAKAQPHDVAISAKPYPGV
jgi:RHH-type rel operon transcriptional repressor/antitoxin RelB